MGNFVNQSASPNTAQDNASSLSLGDEDSSMIQNKKA